MKNSNYAPCLLALFFSFFSPFLTPRALAQPAPSVVVSESRIEQWFDSIEALGTLRANETVALTATVTDTITSIHFDDGQRVEKGFVLAEMTDREESALVREMTARVEEAQRQLERLKDLPQRGAVSESLFDQRQREYHSAQAQLEAMKSRLQDRLIVAPFSGVLGLRNISIGALVEPGDEIVTLTDDSLMKLDFSVPSVFLSSLEIGLPIVAKTDAYPEQAFEGTVTSIDSRIDPVTRSIVIRAVIPNERKLLRPGLLMNVSLRYRFREGLSIPEEAIVPRGSTTEVFVVDRDSKMVEKRAIKLGKRRVGTAEVIAGLEAGELVISHGTMKARPAQKVLILAVQQPGETYKDILARIEENVPGQDASSSSEGDS